MPALVRITTPSDGVFFARASDLEAARYGDYCDVPLYKSDGSPVELGSRADLPFPTITASIVEPVVHTSAQIQETSVEPPKLSAFWRVGRWISGVDRRAARVAAEVQAQANAQSAAEQHRREREEREKTARQERLRAELLRIVETIQHSSQPLVCFRLHSTGERLFARREDWLASFFGGVPLNVLTLPICNPRGEALTDASGNVKTVPWLDPDWHSLYPAFISQPATTNACRNVTQQRRVKPRGPSHPR